MSDVPRLLVIDDDYGWSKDDRNRNREHFCQRVGLQDVTGDVRARSLNKPVAEAVFLQGQREENGRIGNDLDGTIHQVRQAWQDRPRPALLLLDLHFKTGRMGPNGRPRGSNQDRDPHQYFGLTVLEQLWSDSELRKIPVVILSSMDREAIEERFAEHGVYDFFDKSDLDRSALRQLIDTHGLIEDDRDHDEIVGRSLPLLKALREARRRARVENNNILLLGESGTGKELLAEYVHDKSLHHEGEKRPFVTLFTESASDDLIADRLFGHVEGAFTGASDDREGHAEKADGGTLFIDEFGNMPASVQGKLLRLLDPNIRETQRQGTEEKKQVKLQVVMATNKLDIPSDEGFRSDLLARADARNPITLPPLRERPEDIPRLARHFLHEAEEKHDAERREITDDAMAALREYSWPDNVRELENVIDDAVSRYPGLRRLSEAHLGLEDRAPQKSRDQPSQEIDAAPTSPVPPTAPPQQQTVEALIHQLDSATFQNAGPADLEGALPEFRKAYARLVARLLNAALEITRLRPSGELQYSRAVKMATGEEDWSATNAKRHIKKLLKIAPTAVEDLLPELTALREFLEEQPSVRPKQLNLNGSDS
jgi:DNA-binding NtrC family response regulator